MLVLCVLRGVYHPIFIWYHLKFNYSQYTFDKLDDTHLLKHIKQAILVWSFRQNTFLGSLHQNCSILSCYAIAVWCTMDVLCSTSMTQPPESKGSQKCIIYFSNKQDLDTRCNHCCCPLRRLWNSSLGNNRCRYWRFSLCCVK